jgi:hypothetical protein
MTEEKVLFSKTDGSYINQKEADARKERYIQEQIQRGVLEPTRSQFFGTDMLVEMVNKNKSVGIRISFGLNEDGTPNLVLDPLDEFGQVIDKDLAGLKDDRDGSGSNGPICPTHC